MNWSSWTSPLPTRNEIPYSRWLHRVAEKVFIPFTVGGGLRGEDDIRHMLATGADKVSLNTAAVKDPQLIAASSRRFGAQCVVLAVDAKSRGRGAWEVFINGGRTPTGMDAVEWVRRAESLGAGEILLTSMDRDGTKEGYDIELTRAVVEAVNLPVIASGGAGNLDHLAEVIEKIGSGRGARRLHIPLRGIQHPRSKGVPARQGDPRAPVRCTTAGTGISQLRPLPSQISRALATLSPCYRDDAISRTCSLYLFVRRWTSEQAVW